MQPRLVVGGEETPAQKIKRMQDESRAEGVRQAVRLMELLTETGDLAGEITQGGDAYPVGVRDFAGRLSTELHLRAQTLLGIRSRTG